MKIEIDVQNIIHTVRKIPASENPMKNKRNPSIRVMTLKGKRMKFLMMTPQHHNGKR